MKHIDFSSPECSNLLPADFAHVDGVYSTFGKRLTDICLALLILPFITPVIAIIWAIVRLDGSAGFFGHERVGKNGRKFKCWKIRSMCVDSKARLQEYLAENPDAAAEWTLDYKLTNDPRITRIGRFIRKTSLDELPQIVNVLKGEMSFVGPRPVVQDELQRYGARLGAYLSVKPGITGPWQVSGRNRVTYGERVQMDADYANNHSFWSDIKIVACTVGALVNRTGK